MKNMILMARPWAPTIDDMLPSLEAILKSKHFTNFGPKERELSDQLCNMFGSKKFPLFSNGHLALEAMMQALPKGEVIVPSFTFASTVHAIIQAGHKPVFCDIDPNSFCIDVSDANKKITSQTKAILGVHVYGTPCDIENLQDTCKQHNLTLLFDGAHCFGSYYKSKPLGSYGDGCMFSFHATKIFHTVEGGGISINTNRMDSDFIDRYRNFGLSSEGEAISNGSNAKMSEFHAMFGLLGLDRFQEELEARSKISNFYRDHLNDIKELKIPNKILGQNHSYFPILVHYKDPLAFKKRKELLHYLKNQNVMARPYFWPAMHQTKAFQIFSNHQSFPNSEEVSNSVICLPIYSGLTQQELESIVKAVRDGMVVISNN